MLSYAQVIRQLSFMIKMLERVAIELVPFIIVFAIALLMFGFIFACLDLQFGSDYEQMTSPSFIPMAFWVLQNSMGEFDLESFQNMDNSLLIALWLAWVLLVILNMLIFLNFLIAVIGDVYAKVMENRIEEHFQKMAETILVLDFVFGNIQSFQLKETRIMITR